MDILMELFSQQLKVIIERKFHVPTGLSESDFIDRHIMPLEQLLVNNDKVAKIDEGHLPILVVVPHTIVPLSYQLERIRESINDIQLEHIIKPEWFENPSRCVDSRQTVSSLRCGKWLRHEKYNTQEVRSDLQ